MFCEGSPLFKTLQSTICFSLDRLGGALHKRYLVVLTFPKALIITKIVDPIRFRCACKGKVIEAIPFFLQIGFRCREFTLR